MASPSPAEASAGAPAEPVAPAAESMAPMAPAGESAAPAEPVAAAGEARVIDLVATGALQFTDPAGSQVRDIPVTPGETITFRIDNTAGFDHNFYIGTDEQLIVPAGTTDVGIPTWQSGVQEVTWVVPADITGLKFGCTVPGHYALMQGTFSAGAPAEPVAPAAESVAPAGESAAPAEPVAAAGEARVIDLVATGALQFTDPAGSQVRDIPVTPGETITFRIDNTAGFDHNFYIGTDEQLIVPAGTTDVGIPTWQSGVQELTWVVPADITGLKFGCTVPGHYALMQGTFSAGAPAEPVAPAAESMAPMAPAGESAAPAEPVAAAGEARVIDLVATGALQFTDPAGSQVRDIPVTPGETITFRIDNTAGFDHNFYIGTDEQLIVPAGTTDMGIPTWQSGVQELTWVVPADITGLKFGCTVPGHYALMQGTFSAGA